MKKLLLIFLIPFVIKAQGLTGVVGLLDEPKTTFYVSNFLELQNAIAYAKDGGIIQIQNDIEFLASEMENPSLGEILIISKDITIQGESYSNRPKLWNDDSDNNLCLFSVKDANVSFKNIEFNGTDGIEGSARNAIRVGGYYDATSDPVATAIIDSCEVTGWSHAGVSSIDQGNIEVKNSLIKNNRGIGLGYGILVSRGGDATVHHCVMDSNRHHIAGDGHPNSNYIAYENDVYETAFIAQHAFDMHSAAGITGFDASDGRAGDSIVIYNNRFHNSIDNDGYPAIHIRGKPVSGCWIYNNTFDQVSIFPRWDNWSDMAIEQSYEADGTPHYGNMFIGANTYNNLDNKRRYIYDALQIQFNDTSDWNDFVIFGADSSYIDTKYTIDSLVFGDFNGDGITDVVSGFFNNDIYGFGEEPALGDTSLWISWGGMTYWQHLNDRINVSLLDVADVNGDGKSDLIYNETTWSDSGKASFVSLPQAFNTYTLYSTSDYDFDGNSITDNVRINLANNYSDTSSYYSFNGTSNFIDLGADSILGDTSSIFIAFNMEEQTATNSTLTGYGTSGALMSTKYDEAAGLFYVWATNGHYATFDMSTVKLDRDQNISVGLVKRGADINVYLNNMKLIRTYSTIIAGDEIGIRTIGRRSTSANLYFKGRIFNLYTFQRALSYDEIYNLSEGVDVSSGKSFDLSTSGLTVQ